METSSKPTSKTVVPKSNVAETDPKFVATATTSKEDSERSSTKSRSHSKPDLKDGYCKARPSSSNSKGSSDSKTSMTHASTIFSRQNKNALLSCNNNALGESTKSSTSYQEDVILPAETSTVGSSQPHEVETHLSTTHEVETHLSATHQVETHLPPTHQIETHLSTTHQDETRLPPTHRDETRLSMSQQRQALEKLKRISRFRMKSNMTLLSPSASEIKVALDRRLPTEGKKPKLKRAEESFYYAPTPSQMLLSSIVSSIKETNLEETGFDPKSLIRTDPTVARIIMDILQDFTAEDEEVLQNLSLMLLDNMFSNKDVIKMFQETVKDRNVHNEAVYRAVEFFISETLEPRVVHTGWRYTSTIIDRTIIRATKSTNFLKMALKHYLPKRTSESTKYPSESSRPPSESTSFETSEESEEELLKDRPSLQALQSMVSIARKPFFEAAQMLPKVPASERCPRTIDRNKFDFYIHSTWFFEQIEIDDSIVSAANRALCTLMAVAWKGTLSDRPILEESEDTDIKPVRSKETPKKLTAKSRTSSRDISRAISREKSRTPLREGSETTSREELVEEPQPTGEEGKLPTQAGTPVTPTKSPMPKRKVTLKTPPQISPKGKSPVTSRKSSLALSKKKEKKLSLPKLPSKTVSVSPLTPSPVAEKGRAKLSAGKEAPALLDMEAVQAKLLSLNEGELAMNILERLRKQSSYIETSSRADFEVDAERPLLTLPRISLGKKPEIGQECVAAYLARHRVPELFEDLLTSLVLTQPKNPMDSLIERVRSITTSKTHENVFYSMP